MTTTPGELDRKVRQLDNGVTSIYEILHGISAQQSRLLTRLEGLDAAMGSRLDAHDARLDAVDARLDAVGTRLDRIERRLDAHDGRFDRIDEQLGVILTELRGR